MNPLAFVLRLLLTHAIMMIAVIPAIPATADPVAMPIVRFLVLEDEAPLSDVGEFVGAVVDVPPKYTPVAVADTVADVVVEGVEVAVMSESSLSRTQSVSPLQVYP